MRERYSYNNRWSPVMVESIATVSFVMSQKMLRGIRDRTEGRRTHARRLGQNRPEKRSLISHAEWAGTAAPQQAGAS